MKHTPTPWNVFYSKNNDQVILGVGKDTGEGIIASNGSFWREDDEAKANAEFVVKCVNCHDELLEALENVHKLIVEASNAGFNWEKGDWLDRLYFSQQKTFAAINKARGK